VFTIHVAVYRTAKQAKEQREMRKTRASWLLILLGVTAAASAATKPATMVLRNGYVYTMVPKAGGLWDWQYPWNHAPQSTPDRVARAVAIRGSKIVYVGTNSGVREFIGSKTKVIDLRGRMLMPSLIDGHTHTLMGGASLTQPTLEGVPLTVPQVLTRIQGFLDSSTDKEPDGWLQVIGLDYGALQPAGTELYNTDLDTLSTQRPITVFITASHMLIVNSRALALAGITKDTPDPPGGVIGHFPSGEPNGHLLDEAQSLVNDVIPAKTLDDRVDDLKAAQAALLAQGVTESSDAMVNEDDLKVYQALDQAHGLIIRAHPFVLVENTETDAAATVASLNGLKATYQSPKIRIDNAKFFLDGLKAYPVQTGYLLAPYLVNKGTVEDPDWQPGDWRGVPYWQPAALNAFAAALNKAGWTCHYHVVGDAATREALNAAQYSTNQNGAAVVRARRNTIVHIDMSDPADWPRFHQLGVLGSMSLQWAKRDSMSVEGEENYLGPERFGSMYATRSLIENNAVVAAGSDWPVDPLREWFAMEMGVTRTNDEGDAHYDYPLNNQGIPIEQVLRMNTSNSAYQFHEKNQVGSLQVGMLANMIVLNQNVLKIDPSRISETKVLKTIVDGKIVYQQ
jgi:predicted amidohydrolase YtcJ